jgi:hypothetical protein
VAGGVRVRGRGAQGRAGASPLGGSGGARRSLLPWRAVGHRSLCRGGVHVVARRDPVRVGTRQGGEHGRGGSGDSEKIVRSPAEFLQAGEQSLAGLLRLVIAGQGTLVKRHPDHLSTFNEADRHGIHVGMATGHLEPRTTCRRRYCGPGMTTVSEFTLRGVGPRLRSERWTDAAGTE